MKIEMWDRNPETEPEYTIEEWFECAMCLKPVDYFGAPVEDIEESDSAGKIKICQECVKDEEKTIRFLLSYIEENKASSDSKEMLNVKKYWDGRHDAG